jgi:hypothetical protein
MIRQHGYFYLPHLLILRYQSKSTLFEIKVGFLLQCQFNLRGAYCTGDIHFLAHLSIRTETVPVNPYIRLRALSIVGHLRMSEVLSQSLTFWLLYASSN